MFKNTIYDILENIAFQNKIDGDVPSSIDIIALKSDFVVPLNSTSKFETGVKTANTNTNNEAIYNNTIESITLPDYNLSNRFLYDEWIHAGYVNYTKSYKRIELQLGLRAEITSFKGNQRGNVENLIQVLRECITIFFLHYISPGRWILLEYTL